MFFSTVLLLLIAAYLVRWATTSYGSRVQALDPGQTAEIARLRDEVDQLTAQVVRLQDEQTFMMRLLTDGGASKAEPLAPAPEPAPNPEMP